MKGARKLILGLYYLTGVFGIAGLLVWKHSPLDWTAYGFFAGGAATGVGAVIWGNIREHQAEHQKP